MQEFTSAATLFNHIAGSFTVYKTHIRVQYIQIYPSARAGSECLSSTCVTGLYHLMKVPRYVSVNKDGNTCKQSSMRFQLKTNIISIYAVVVHIFWVMVTVYHWLKYLAIQARYRQFRFRWKKAPVLHCKTLVYTYTLFMRIDWYAAVELERFQWTTNVLDRVKLGKCPGHGRIHYTTCWK